MIRPISILLFVTSLLSTHLLTAQVTIRITSFPTTTPSNPTFFLAGTMNAWNPGDSDFIFSKVGSNYEITLPAASGTAQYKITRGSWATGEGTASGGQSSNRSFTYAPNLVVEIQIAGWEGNSGKPSTALPNVKIISSTFLIPQLGKLRRVWIYLPENYTKDSTTTYPVMYMHDGQNLFDAATSFSGEWGIDETLVAKEKQGDKGCIVVGIDNGGGSRLDEYSPYKNPTYGGGQGDEYVSFLTTTLKPYIDANYRTKPEREFTGIAGSSMGGLISLYAALKHPTVYSKVGIFSPAFWFSDSLRQFVAGHTNINSTKFYFVAGANESLSLVKDMDTIISTLKAIGFENKDIERDVKADGAHSEWFWKREFGPCYSWLFSEITSGTQQNIKHNSTKLIVFPNPTNQSFSLNQPADEVVLSNQLGKELFRWHKVTPSQLLQLPQIKNGVYYLNIRVGATKIIEKLLVE